MSKSNNTENVRSLSLSVYGDNFSFGKSSKPRKRKENKAKRQNLKSELAKFNGSVK